MRTDIQYANNKTWAYFQYDHFGVDYASEEYPLSMGGYKGTVFKGLYDGHDGAKFSTYDNENDKAHFTCAITSKCGWWYYVCDAINPNKCPPEVSLWPNNEKCVMVDMKDIKTRLKQC